MLGRAAVGTAEAAGSPTGMSLISDYFGKDRRATAIGIWYLSSGIGLAIAFVVGGAIVEQWGWRWAFAAAGVPGLLLAPVLFLTVREPPRGGQDGPDEVVSDEQQQLSLPARLRLLAARPGLLYCIFAIVMIATGIYGMSTWLSTYLIRVYDVPIGRSGMIIAGAYGGLGSLGGFLAGGAIDWVNRRRNGFEPALTARFGAAIPILTALAGIGMVMVSDYATMLVMLMACGFLSASYNGPIYAVIVTIAGPRLRGLAVSTVQLGANLVGVGAGAYLIGAVSDYVGGVGGVAWGIGAAMLFTFAGGILLLLGARAIDQDRKRSLAA